MSNRNTQPDEGIFDSALANQRPVSETFFIDFSADKTIEQNLRQSDEAVQHRIRQFMEAANSPTQFLFNFQTYGNNSDDAVRADLSGGAIAAIDSTDILPVTDLMNTSFYAVGVGCITSRNRNTPEVVLTTTSTCYTRPEKIALNNSDLLRLCKELDKVRETKGSWATTFREYQERKVAISCEQETVLLDGPVFTQNLITQHSGRELYSRMMQTGKRFIGVIKDLGSSWALSKWTAMSLERGEGFVLCPIQEQYKIRFGDNRGYQRKPGQNSDKE